MGQTLFASRWVSKISSFHLGNHIQLNSALEARSWDPNLFIHLIYGYIMVHISIVTYLMARPIPTAQHAQQGAFGSPASQRHQAHPSGSLAPLHCSSAGVFSLVQCPIWLDQMIKSMFLTVIYMWNAKFCIADGVTCWWKTWPPNGSIHILLDTAQFRSDAHVFRRKATAFSDFLSYYWIAPADRYG